MRTEARWKQENAPFLPQARTKDLVFQDLGNETLVYDLRRHKAHCLNEAARAVFQMCDGRTAVAEIAHSLTGQLTATFEDEVVWLALERLARAHLLERPRIPPGRSILERRKALQQLALSAALPLVISITAPLASSAATCLAVGDLCLINADCCSTKCDKGKCK